MSEPLALGVVVHVYPDPKATLALVKSLGVPTVQFFYHEGLESEAGFAALQGALAETGIEVTSVVCIWDGERYDDIAAVRETVGLVPELTRAARVASILHIAQFAKRIGVNQLQAHIGFIPEEPSDPLYSAMVGVMQNVCDAIALNGQWFALETGQETAEGLRQFLNDVARPNLKVNFDPANMILYGTGRPEAALDVLIPWIVSVHCKDGTWPEVAGQLGQETPLSWGEVYFANWLKKLISLGYRGPLTIEREISGEKQIEDIREGTAIINAIVSSEKL